MSAPVAVLFALAVGLSGCGTVPRIDLPTGERIAAPRDPGKPAEVARITTTTALPVAAGSTVETVAPAAPDRPPSTRITLAAPAVFTTETTSTLASTGTVDTTVAVRRADNAARLPLLWAAIGAVVAAVVFLVLKYPTGALLSGAAAVAFFLAWQASGLPPWFWTIGLAGLAIAAGIYVGFERAERNRKAVSA